MADKKITELTEANIIEGTELVPVVQGTETKKVTVNTLKKGNLTTNYIPKTTATGQGDSQIIDNGTNVGIGTLPLAKLHVNGTFLVEDESDENPKFEITQTNINGIVDGSGFMISGSNVEFGQNVGDELIGLKIDVDGKNYLRNQLGDYFGLDSTTNLIISESLTSQGSPSNTTTPIKWILIKAGTTDYYLPLYQ